MLHIFGSVFFKIKALFMASHLCEAFRCRRRTSRLFVVPNKSCSISVLGVPEPVRACVRQDPVQTSADLSSSVTHLPKRPVWPCRHMFTTVSISQFVICSSSVLAYQNALIQSDWPCIRKSHVHTGVCLCVTQHLLWEVYSILYDDFKYDSLKS